MHHMPDVYKFQYYNNMNNIGGREAASIDTAGAPGLGPAADAARPCLGAASYIYTIYYIYRCTMRIICTMHIQMLPDPAQLTPTLYITLNLTLSPVTPTLGAAPRDAHLPPGQHIPLRRQLVPH